MKTLLACGLAALFGGITAAYFVSTTLSGRNAALLAAERTLWEQQETSLRADLDAARSQPRPAPSGRSPSATPPVPVGLSRPTPAELLARLRSMQIASAPGSSRAMRHVIHDMEELILAGTNSLPVIRGFLALQQDIEYGGQGRGGRFPDDFMAPPTLRVGLMDVVKRIGGAEAEQLLADTLGMSRRGSELAWITRALQEMAPDRYRDAALARAREMLALPGSAGAAADRNEREQLFSILSLYLDTSYAGTAQAQLIQADGSLDRAALRYLQQTLGPQAVSVAAQAWQDPRLTDPSKKEPLARLALNFVGADAQANELYQRAINDLNLPKDHRRNLIEDLNQDGFPDLKNLGARDLPLIQSRLALIEELAPGASDPINRAAFAEAYKDLVNMRDRALRAATPPP